MANEPIRKQLEDVTLEAMISETTKYGNKELLFVCPIVSQTIAASRTIDKLIGENEPACLGLICRQIFELLITLEYVFSIKSEAFNDFCKFFVNNQRVGRYDKKEKKWKNACYEYLCDKYIKTSKNDKIKEVYDALCRMSHFSLNHATETLRLDRNTLEVTLSGHREDSEKICKAANVVQAELVRLMTEAVKREYLR